MSLRIPWPSRAECNPTLCRQGIWRDQPVTLAAASCDLTRVRRSPDSRLTIPGSWSIPSLSTIQGMPDGSCSGCSNRMLRRLPHGNDPRRLCHNCVHGDRLSLRNSMSVKRMGSSGEVSEYSMWITYLGRNNHEIFRCLSQVFIQEDRRHTQ